MRAVRGRDVWFNPHHARESRVCGWRQKVTRLSRHVLMPCLGLVRLVRNEPSPRGTPWADFKSGMQGKCRSVWPVSEAKPKRISFPNPIPQLTSFPVSYYTLRIEAEEERRRAQRWRGWRGEGDKAPAREVTRRRRRREEAMREAAKRRRGTSSTGHGHYDCDRDLCLLAGKHRPLFLPLSPGRFLVICFL
jgi:hypothetical protein